MRQFGVQNLGYVYFNMQTGGATDVPPLPPATQMHFN